MDRGRGRRDDRDVVREKLGIFRAYKPGGSKDDGYILAGENPRSGGDTRDHSFTTALLDHLKHMGEEYTDRLDRKQIGLAEDKPSLIYCGFEFPHTPVLPPAEFQEKFRKFHYEVPTLTADELAGFPNQIQKLYKNSQSDHFTDEGKAEDDRRLLRFLRLRRRIGRPVDGWVYRAFKKTGAPLDDSLCLRRPWLASQRARHDLEVLPLRYRSA